MKLLVTTILFLFCIQFCIAQKPYKLYKMESIYLVGNKYIKNDVSYPVGFMGTKLNEEMQISPYAIAEWDKFKKLRNGSMITSLAGLGLALGSLVADNESTQRNLLLGGLGLSIVSLPISIKANSQLQKAIWTRNRDLFQY